MRNSKPIVGQSHFQFLPKLLIILENKFSFLIIRNIVVLRRSWRESEIAQLNFYRKRHVEYFFWAVTSIFEPEYSQSRIAFAQVCMVATVLDDLYDTHGLLDELKTFTEGVRR